MKITGLTPMLETENMDDTVRFYTEILEFELIDQWKKQESIDRVMLKKDDGVIMFSSRIQSIDETPIGFTGALYLNASNIDEIWEEIRDNPSVTLEWGVRNWDYGMRDFAIRDNNGYLLVFGEPIK